MLTSLARRRRFPHKPRHLRGYYGGATLSVTFPVSPLTARIYIALGADLTASWLTWSWLDITDRVRVDIGVSATDGRREGSTFVNTSSATLKIENRDGYFSRRNPLSPYFGMLTKNTPIWIQLDPGSGFFDFYQGYVNEWPTRWTDQSGSDTFVTVRCAGVLRRLAQGINLQPCLHRAIVADNPVHYWRLDDPAGTVQATSSLANGGRTMLATNMGWRQIQSPPGGDGEISAAKLNSAYLFIDRLNVSPPWTIEWSTLRPSDGTLDGQSIFQIRWTAGGSVQQVGVSTAEDTNVSARDWYHYKLEAIQDGANWSTNYWRNGVDRGTAGSGPGTLGTLDEISSTGFGITASDFSVGYVAIYQGVGVVDQVARSEALQGFAGEMAHERIARVCGEEGVPVRVSTNTSAAMGPQPHGTLLGVVRECETADQGMLYEHQFGLAYQSLYERCNQPVTLALDFNQRHIAGTPEPADDDQRLRNQWTVTRADSNASRTARDQNSVDTSGLYDDSVTANLGTDDVLLNHAGWRVHVGVVDEDRWPSLMILLHGTPDLIPAWQATPLGGRVTVDNPPAQMPPDQIDAILEGRTQRFDTVSWGAALNLAPASPYRVATLDDGDLGRVDSASSTLTADVDSTTTSISVTTATATDLWTTDAAEVPFDIVIAGEVMRVATVTSATSPQTFTVTRSINGVVKTHTAGAQVHVRYPATLAL